jgi:hypothetical protein
MCLKKVHQRDRVGADKEKGKGKKKGKRSIGNEKWGKEDHDNSIKRGSQQTLYFASTSWQKRDSENVTYVLYHSFENRMQKGQNQR